MKSLKIVVVFVAIFFAVGSTMAADYYVRAGASGANNGADWTNAYTSLPTTLIRGSTYYIAGGSYPGRTFNTATSGTSFIEIKGATIADHGTETGWSNSYSVENNQAKWTSGISFNTSYWIFDGSIGPVWSKDPSKYGFSFSVMTKPISIFNTSTTITDIVVANVSAIAPSGDVEKFFVQTNNSTKSVHNVTIKNCYGSGWGNFIWATSAGLAMSNWVVEYNAILNGFSSAANHGEDINNNYGRLDNLVIRYNLFESRTTGTGSIVVLNGPAGPYYIYGNVFKDMRGGDGIITGVHYTLSGAVYNNTFINCDNGYGNGVWIGHDVSATVQNNLIANSVAGIGSRFTGKIDYNAYFNTTNTPSEPNRQIIAGNPFVNLPGGNFRLSSGTSAGLPLSSMYSNDVDGKIRGSDGTWDRGAFEFGGSETILNPPKNLIIK